MEVEIKVDSSLDEKIIIQTKELTPEIHELVNRIKLQKIKTFTGIRDQKIYLLNHSDIYYFYSENQKIFAKLETDVVQIRLKLFEIEEQLSTTKFLRVSNSVIANFEKIKNLEMTFNGTICIKFKNGDTEYSSRRYVSKIKNFLDL